MIHRHAPHVAPEALAAQAAGAEGGAATTRQGASTCKDYPPGQHKLVDHYPIIRDAYTCSSIQEREREKESCLILLLFCLYQSFVMWCVHLWS